jgi:hypothetical protein
MDAFLFGFLVFFIITFILIFNRDRFMGLFYFVLFVYCYFTIFAYTYFPEKSYIINSVEVNKTEFFWFKLYIFLSFVSFNIIYFILFSRFRMNKRIADKNKSIKFSFSPIDTVERKPYKMLFLLIGLFYIMSLGQFLILNYGQLSYNNQTVLKSNKIIFMMYDYCFIFIFIFLLAYKKFKKAIYGKVCLLFGFIVFLIFMLISIRIGSRGVFIGYAIAVVYYICDKYNIQLKVSYIKPLFKITIIALCAIGLSQFIRKTRGGVVDFNEVDFLLSDIKSFFKLEQLVFQDYATPSATLMYSIKENVVIPGTVILSDILNIPVILDYVTLGEYISRLVSPLTNWGMGYYILTWGYNLIGFMGFFLTPFIILILFKLYYRFFFYLNDKKFAVFIQTVIAVYLILPVVRGQMYPFIKHIYVYFIPSIILYCIAMGIKIKFTHSNTIMNNN